MQPAARSMQPCPMPMTNQWSARHVTDMVGQKVCTCETGRHRKGRGHYQDRKRQDDIISVELVTRIISSSLCLASIKERETPAN